MCISESLKFGFDEPLTQLPSTQITKTFWNELDYFLDFKIELKNSSTQLDCQKVVEIIDLSNHKTYFKLTTCGTNLTFEQNIKGNLSKRIFGEKGQKKNFKYDFMAHNYGITFSGEKGKLRTLYPTGRGKAISKPTKSKIVIYRMKNGGPIEISGLKITTF